jgi:transposase
VTLDNIDVDKTIQQVEALLAQEQQLSPTLKALIQVLITLVTLLTNRLNLNSRNSSKPPSSDPNRKKNNRNSKNKPGGQKGHVGATLQPVDDPDDIQFIRIDRRTLPPGQYFEVGIQSRQVIDIDLSTFVTEYQAQVLEDASGAQFVAQFPSGVTRPVQYGSRLKAQAVYLSQFQLLPYHRIQDFFSDQLNIPVSTGSLVNFNQQAYGALDQFEVWLKRKLSNAQLLPMDETSINVGGNEFGYTVLATRYTRIMPHILSGAVRPWMISLYYLVFVASFVMTTGNLILRSIVHMPCAMPIICANCPGLLTRMANSGHKSCTIFCWNSILLLMMPPVC